VGAGVDNVREQRKLEARKMLENGDESPPSSVCSARRMELDLLYGTLSLRFLKDRPTGEETCPKHHQGCWDDSKGKHDPVNRHRWDRSIGLNIGVDSRDKEIPQVMHYHGWQQAAGLESDIAIE
jgi:hypothetical protein